MTDGRWAAGAVAGVVVSGAVVLAAVALVGPSPAASGDVGAAPAGPRGATGPPVTALAADTRPSAPDLIERLDRAIEVSATASLRGRLTVASLGDSGPQVTTVEVVRRSDGRLRATRQGAWELGRDDDGGYLRSDRTGRLLELGGVETRSFDRSRFLERYRVADRGSEEVDTGPARVVEVIDRDLAVVREVLHLDDETGLIVRRETRDSDGQPLRIVAYTAVEVDEDVAARPTPQEGLEAERVALDPVERRELTERGIPAVASLPGGFTLLDAAEVRGTGTPTVHLVYGDGLYTLSIYVQRGGLAPRAIRQAARLELAEGNGAVWRWPGSEPRRVVWSGGGRTFTGVTDAPTGVLLTAVTGLPNEPPPSTLERLTRGFTRVGERLLPPWNDADPGAPDEHHPDDGGTP